MLQIIFIDDELEVGDCRKENFSCKLSGASQVRHGTSTCDFVILFFYVLSLQFRYCKSQCFNAVV